MTEYTSNIKTIPYNDSQIFSVLSDLRKLENIKDQLPEDKVKDFTYEQDSCSVNVSPIGTVRFNIVEREPNSTIKFEAEKLPFQLNLWVQLKQVGEKDTKMKLTIKADINAFLKPMVAKPLQEGLEKMADLLSTIPFDKIDQ